ncbi:penicillin-binding transpeptidase domain-containing protein [Candidatus Omnitrophota bacterium]
MQLGPHVTRQKFLMLLLGMMWVVLVVRLWIIQYVDHDGHYNHALNQRVKPFVIKAQRGEILDRNGAKMAVSVESSSYGISPEQIENKSKAARILSLAVNKRYEDIETMLSSGKPYLWLARQASPGVIKNLDGLHLAGLHKHKDFNRFYQYGKVGAHIIGITNVDNYGIEGSELYFNDDLMGRDGRTTVLRDAKGKSQPSLDKPLVNSQNGMDVVLTIDWKIQDIAEYELESCLKKTGARWGGAIVLDSGTGEILAMANVPVFDPNKSRSFSGAHDIIRNRLVTDMFEPGSIFKIVAFTEILDTGILTENDMIDCENGRYRIFNHTINDTHELEVVPVSDVLIHSSNIGTVKIAEKIGKKRLYKRARLMGFGEVTGIDFPYETPGRLPNPRKWSKLSLPTISFGQGVAVSPLQIIMAYGALANGGNLMTPIILKEIVGNTERAGRTNKSQIIRRVMSENTARRLTDLFVSVVEEGTGKSASLPNMRIGGKTGTAQRIEEGKKGYIPGRYISSFIGFLPDCKKKIVCLIMVDSPKGLYYGSQVAAPVFKNIINRLVNLGSEYKNHQIAQIDTTNIKKTVCVPDVRKRKILDAVMELHRLGLKTNIVGDSTVVARQSPLSGAQLNIGSLVTLYGGSSSTKRTGYIEVPNLIGKSVREAVQNLVQVNLEVIVLGKGVVSSQKPRPGMLVNQGTICKITCNRR